MYPLQAAPLLGVPSPLPRPSGKIQNDRLAQTMITNAQDFEQKELFADAEELYLMAIQYSSKSEDYAHLPRLLVKKNDKERAASGFIVLADLQIAEGKQGEAIASLKISLELISSNEIKEKLGQIMEDNKQGEEAARLFLELAFQALNDKDIFNATRLSSKARDLFPGFQEAWKTLAAIEQDPSSSSNILLKGANEPSMPIKMRLELCNMAVLKNPDCLQAKFLFSELNQLKMQDKVERLKRALNQALQENKQLKEENLRFQVESKKIQVTLISPTPVIVPVQPALVIQQLPGIAFGKAKWATHFGDIGEEPPLPDDIHQILSSPCPFWPNKKVEETHLLVLIPKTVNGQLLTLTTLKKLINKPKQGNVPKFSGYHLRGNENLSIAHSYWVLMTRDVLKGTRKRSYYDQKQIVSGFCQKTGIDYQPPGLLEAVVCIFMEYVSKGTRLYNDNPMTYTRCHEKYEGKDYQMVVGGFSVAGLAVDLSSFDNEIHALAFLRKF